MSYQAKGEAQLARQLKTQRLVLPFKVTGHATPGSKTIVVDDPQVLFLKFEGKDGLTLALGAVDSAAELSALTLATATDTTGIFNALIRVEEAIDKVLLVRLCKVGAIEANVCGTSPTGATRFLSSVGDKIVANFDCTTAFEAAADTEWVIEVEYQVS